MIRKYALFAATAGIAIVLVLIGILFGLRSKEDANLRLSSSAYKDATLCLRVLGPSDVWPPLAVIVAAEHVQIGGNGLAILAVEPETDRQALEAGLKADIAAVESLALRSSSSLAIGTAIPVGDAVLISLVPPTDAVRESLPSVQAVRYHSTDELPDNCPGGTAASTDDTLHSSFDVSVAAFGGGSEADLSAEGGDADRLLSGVGKEIQVSAIASIVTGGSSVPGLLPDEVGAGNYAFALPVRLGTRDRGPVSIAAPGTATAEANVAGSAIVAWRANGMNAELFIDDQDPLRIGEDDVVEFTTSSSAEHSRWLTMSPAGDIEISARISGVLVKGESRMPPRTRILDNWQSHVFWWAAFGLIGFALGSLRRSIVEP